jgi:hypothetical protein
MRLIDVSTIMTAHSTLSFIPKNQTVYKNPNWAAL